MKLEINNSGAWKTIARFLPADLEAVRCSVHLLDVVSLDKTVTYRLLDDAGNCTQHWQRNGEATGKWFLK